MSGLRSINAEVLTLRQRSIAIAESIGIGVGFRKFKRNREEGKIFFRAQVLEGRCLQRREASDTPLGAASSAPPTAKAGAFVYV